MIIPFNLLDYNRYSMSNPTGNGHPPIFTVTLVAILLTETDSLQYRNDP